MGTAVNMEHRMATLRRLFDNPWFLAGGVAVAVVLWLASGSIGREQAPAAPLVAARVADAGLPAVRAVLQHAEPVTREIVVYGRTAPARTVEIGAETSGRIEAVLARRGEPAAAGEPLVRLFVRDREARVAEAEAAVRRYETEYEAQRDLESASYVSQTQIAETRAELEAARAALKLARLDLAATVIRAPFDGTLAERFVEVGDYVGIGDPVASFIDDRTLVVEGTVPERMVVHVRAGGQAAAKLVTGDTVEGRIRYVSPVADEATRTFAVEAELDNSERRLPAGVTAEMSIPAGEVLAHRISPALLTLDDEGELGLKLVDDQGTVSFLRADIVRSGTDGVWVAGLPETAAIITVGQGYVTPGSRVEPVFSEPGEQALAAEELKP